MCCEYPQLATQFFVFEIIMTRRGHRYNNYAGALGRSAKQVYQHDFSMLNVVLLPTFSGYSRFGVRSEGAAETAAETLQQTDSRRGHVDTGWCLPLHQR